MERPLDGTTGRSSHKCEVAKWTLEGLRAELKDGEENKPVFFSTQCSPGLPNGALEILRLGVVDVGMQELKC